MKNWLIDYSETAYATHYNLHIPNQAGSLWVDLITHEFCCPLPQIGLHDP